MTEQAVLLRIHTVQLVPGEPPEVMELQTEGVLRQLEDRVEISYVETRITGLEGVETTFAVYGTDKVILTRKGALNSRMIFQKGVVHESLYQMPFGALMLSVRATSVFYDILPEGGVIDLSYNIEIENTQAGVIDYHLDIRAK